MKTSKCLVRSAAMAVLILMSSGCRWFWPFQPEPAVILVVNHERNQDGSISILTGDELVFTAVASGVSSFRYDWRVTNWSVSGDIEKPDAGPELSWSFETAGRYAVQVTIVDALGRESWPDVLEILVADPPPVTPPSTPIVVAITASPPGPNFLISQEITFTATITPAIPPGASILWHFRDFTGQPGGLVAKHTYQTRGQFRVLLQVATIGGTVIATGELSIEVFPPN